MDEPTGPHRPKELHFVRVKNPGKPLVLTWDPPLGEAAGFIVYATENRFPPHMAGPLFEGKMRQFIDEQRLEPGSIELRVARAESYYGVVWFDVDDNYYPVENLAEPASAEVFVDIKAFAFTQTRTYLRVRFTPPPVAMRDKQVELYIRDVEPNAAALARMAAGEMNPDYVLTPKGDGFIDTVSDQEWRKFYVAVAVGRDGVRRPMDLEAGAYLRVEEPQYLEREGKRKCDALMEKVRDQIEVELQRRSVTEDDMRKMIARADSLSPFNPMVERLRRKARERFPDL